ncbi:FAD-dependent oxidoreductase [Natrarchaeobius oligotrophus]|nr:FAD-dependent oxidoreductase [Natrarchaeobius chitinivorans]
MSADPVEGTEEVDVIVVGGGGAGMAAAAAAAESEPDADVVLLQKLDELGGTTTMAMGSYAAANTDLQAERGIDDSAAAHAADLGRFLRAAADPTERHPILDRQQALEETDDRRLRRLLVENAGETLSWLEDLGCEHVGPYWEPPHRVPRLHQIVPDTDAYADVLGDQLRDRGVEVLLRTRARQLVTENGRIVGVNAETESGSRTIRSRNGVVLATGDYHSSQRLRERYTTDSGTPPITEFNTGDGHQMAAEVGARLVGMDVQLLFLRMGAPLYTSPDVAALVEDGAVIVNERGERFVTEAVDYEQLLYATVDQPGSCLYVVFDESIASRYTEWPNYLSTLGKDGKMWGYVDDYLEYGGLHRSESLEALAEKVGIPTDTLATTLTEYNDGVEIGAHVVDPMGRERTRRRLREPPFYALGPVNAYAGSAEGGIDVTAEMAALDEGGEPIKGLYAAGSAAGSVQLFGHGHHLPWAFTTGRIAGRAAVDDRDHD